MSTNTQGYDIDPSACKARAEYLANENWRISGLLEEREKEVKELKKRVAELEKKVDDNKRLRPIYMARMDAESRLCDRLEGIIVKIARGGSVVEEAGDCG